MFFSRTALWIAFAINALLCIIYAVVGFVTFSNILNFQKNMTGDDDWVTAMRGLIAGSFLSSLAVCVFVLASLFLMIGNFVGRGFGFAYGFVCSAAINLAITLLITAMNFYYWMDRFEDYEKYYSWSASKTSGFTATVVMGFILFVWLIVYFIYLLLSKGSLDMEGAVDGYPSNSKSQAFGQTNSGYTGTI
eukprot:TRINITY_DN72069_c0_g1_i1.p2 TRINITY_DN72069_c0_g1~~TRINITY_DN72069_c0_g1_i1.p2  ORF type:complete len:191 (-),score=30.63 TRINITY_DN72069_c0_g1_i1:516-1088(-)